MAGRNRITDSVRHRILESMLRRLARLPAADQFVLRGGMLLRLWFHPWERPAADLDLVATYPFDIDQTRRILTPLFETTPDDGIALDPEQFRVQGIWLNTDFPGVRVFAASEADGEHVPFSMDITFGEPLVPAPEQHPYPMPGHAAPRIWMCRPETIVGRKLHALWNMGMLHWRPKDLNDLRLLMGRLTMQLADLSASITASFVSRGDTPADARTLFDRELWWTTKSASARWNDFRDEFEDTPASLPAVVREVAERLRPSLEQLP